ncbi:DUF1573 domain-containing protein [Cesiribacter andamanensis]|uniref:DUF1573 domain-containing protein n=1 Tax=Cesiribacter andamanensis AMV16 TaxID=1279009 RepID=M7N621_9BACT|nr:DUF1573 domain-containing protein [Cesiribacter andamanensis]EMR02686.1 hypothetical protein ADICEAN_02163 [Cesiribacter andamanensis AMV16]
MKKLILSCLMLLFAFAAVAQEKAATEKGPQITFQETEYNFGDIQQGDKVEHIFTFKNTGTAPLILSNVLTTCGCTAPEWPKDPVAPGKTAQIKITFNSAGKMGKQNKVITIVSNATNAQERVALVGNILPKQNADLQ